MGSCGVQHFPIVVPGTQILEYPDCQPPNSRAAQETMLEAVFSSTGDAAQFENLLP